ncbi:MAG: monofunctional biosynthetic peptidoglycan transglycosylase [Parvularculaceae bacterium]|nr:monofunctional biosynthetic peptidoglycan transglycosylase [Parvularculaceae bacterium]
MTEEPKDPAAPAGEGDAPSGPRPAPVEPPADGAESTREEPDPPARPRWRAALTGVAFALGGAFAASVLWIAAYRFLDPPGTFIMADRALGGADVRYDFVPLKRISPHLVRAVISGEDSRFCFHDGFDFEAIEEAAEHNKRSKRRRGASTLTQQTAKNAFLWNEGGWVRKGAEAYFAAGLDLLWTKRRVMVVYLNIAEWGDGLFGAEAAARKRFGKSAAALTRQEAALLAAVLPSPNKWRVDPPGPYVKRRAAVLRQRMEIVERDRLDACVLSK